MPNRSSKRNKAAAPSARKSNLNWSGVKQGLGFGMVIAAAITSYFIVPLPIAVGLTLLAAARIGILLREERKQQAAGMTDIQTICETR